MKKVLIALVALGTASPAAAISRYNTPGMTCESIRNALRSEGAAVLRYPSARKPDLTLYDRYVRSSSQCSVDQFADRAYVPAKDNPRCPVLQCKPLPDPENPWPMRLVPPNLRL
ncbi:hypothetical protein NOF55_17725 [Rhizobiaceae bacterium BDR2-2]|uniref:Uncharacterized protein n=1 Tax=Ectorhizobium quercum TaxID=2965071 RepID=A0AAE3SXD7_9HYPH|nr:hypothetical protein [Ectorhizobium quercum]MCX8998949.1 hypothetical protein [Ectorhizobium quercum]